MAKSVETIATATTADSTVVTSDVRPDFSPISGVKVVHRDIPGFSVPDLGLSLTHTVSLWITRDASPVIDNDAALEPIRSGDTVTRSKGWPEAVGEEEVPLGLLGMVTSVQDNDSVAVDWANGKKGA
jgi:hypothetical protein